MIRRNYLYLIIARKVIHECEDDASKAVIDGLIDVRSREIILRKIPIEISKIDTNSNHSLFFVHEDDIRNQFCQWYKINESNLKKFLNLFLNGCHFPWMNLM